MKKQTSSTPLRTHLLRGTFLLVLLFLVIHLMPRALAERQINAPPVKEAAIRIVDQNGRPAVNGVPSPTGTIFDVTVGPGFAFAPDTLNISVGDTVRWTWAGNGHSVTSGPPCAADSQFCSR